MSIMHQGTSLVASGATELRQNRCRDRSQAIRALCGGERVIYAIRLRDGVIKIGCTARLDRRRAWFGPDAEVVGFIPGDFDDERAIHDSLAPHVERGREYYRPEPPVLAVVNQMRDRFNLPHLAA